MRNIFKALKNVYRDKIHLSPEFRLSLAEANFRNILIILHIGFVFGVTNLLGILGKFKFKVDFTNGVFVYFFMFTCFSFIGLFISLLIRKVFKSKNSYVLNIPFYFALAAELFCITYRTEFYQAPFSGLLLIASFNLVFLIFCNPYPWLLLLFNIFPFIVIGKNIINEYGIAVLADLILFGVIMFILSFYKRYAVRNRLQNEKDLIDNRIHLEKMFTEQSFEIERQAVELIHQNRKLAKMKDETILSLSNLVENRDKDTGVHVKRTQAYVKHIAYSCFKDEIYPEVITEDFIDLAAKAAPMHDIGKILVSDQILKKPGKLTDEEFEQIKLHAKDGGDVVLNVLGKQEDQEYVKMACDIATYHHEKWNGTGYPSGLKEDKIPVSARIMAIADVFDALVSKRCYKAAMSYDEAFGVMEASSGSHFDPVLLKIFLANKDQIIAIAEKYKDNQ